MKRNLHTVLLFLFLVFGSAYAQIDRQAVPKKIYSDRITDQDGKPLSGILVRVKGKGLTAYTDVNGEFTINAVNGDIIVLSHQGKIINTYRLDGSIYYEMKDESEVLTQDSERRASVPRKARIDNTNLYKTWLDSAQFYKKNRPTKSIGYIENALKIATENKNKTQLAQTYTILGDVYMNLKQYDLALSNYSIAQVNSKSTAGTLKLANALLLNNEFEKSETTYTGLLKSRGISTVQKVAIYEGLGNVYQAQNQAKKALNQYQTALNLSKRIHNTDLIASLNSKISGVLESQGETEKAEDYLLESNEVAKKNPQNAVVESNKAAEFYSRNNSVDKEVVQRQQTLKNLEDADLDEVVLDDEGVELTKQKAKLDLGNALLKQNKPAEAIIILEESAAEAANTDDIKTQKDAVQKLSEAYVSLGNENKALSNYKKYVSLVDILYKQKEEEINSVVRLNRDLSDKQNRITSLEKDRELSESKFQLYQTENQLTVENDKRQKTIIYALLAGLGLLLFSLFWMLRSNKQRKLANNLLALKSLRTQMNPHFIFNALNSVNSFIAKNDERTANRYLTDFSTLMRSVLINSEEDFIPLEKELELLSLYLKLEHSRFEDKFDYELNVDDAIEQEQFLIPPMLLQPYVENAVWHGLRYKKEKGLLKVELKKVDETTIQIEISDNGIGRKKSKELKTDHQKKQQSKGMQNIKRRIAILNEMYKDKVDVFIEDLKEDATGTKVLLIIKR